MKKFLFSLYHYLLFPFCLIFLLVGLVSSRKKLKNFEFDNESLDLNERYDYVYKLTSLAVFCANTKIIIKGSDNLPKKTSLFVCNHKSNFDPVVFLNALKKISSKKEIKPVTFVAKKELSEQKFIGPIIKLINGIFLDRKNLRDGLKVINLEKEIISNGEQSVLVFIEGTRIKKDEFGDFRSAALEPAYLTYCPIVPTVIYGTLGVEKKNKMKIFKYKEITVEFLKPIKYKNYIHLSKMVVCDRIKLEMEKKYNELKKDQNS